MTEGMLAGIGNTPAVRLERLVEPGMAEVWVKLEAANPTGSYKDRMALAMIEGAERDGRLSPGQWVVEYTGGSTGSSLAFVCAVKGYPLQIVTSDAFADEKLRTMEAFGARLEVLPSPEGITPELIPRMRARAAELAAVARRVPDRPVQEHGHGGRLPAPRARRWSSRCRARSTRCACTSGRPGASSASAVRCASAIRPWPGSPSNPASRPCCRADPRARTASRAAASGSDRSCCRPTRSTT